MLHATVVSLLLLQVQPVAPAPRSTALIIGRVVDAASGKPVPGATVGISGASLPRTPLPPRLMTDSQGRFVFRNLAPGSYGLTASRPGYNEGAYGRRRPDGGAQPLDLREGQRATDVTILLWKYAAIGGTVVDEAGQPVVGAQVRALQKRIVSGQPVLSAFGVSLASDDRGMYRIASLSPGDYVVIVSAQTTSVPPSVLDAYQPSAGGNDPVRQAAASAIISLGPTAMTATGPYVSREADAVVSLPRGLSLPNGEGAPRLVYPPTYHPGTSLLAQAAVVRLASGEERNGVDIQLRPVPAITISGTVMRPDGPEMHAGVKLDAPESARGFAADGYGTVTDGTGQFAFRNVASGSYVLRVIRVPSTAAANESTMTVIQSGGTTIMSSVSSGAGTPAPVSNEPTWWATIPIQAGRQDITGLQVPLQEGVRFSGRIEFDGTADRPEGEQLRRVAVNATVADGWFVSGNRAAQVDSDGTFRTVGLPGGKYFLRASSPLPDWTFKSATFQGRDLADVPIDISPGNADGIVITFTDRPSEISGSVQRTDGIDPDAVVLVFPSDPALWDVGTNPRRMRLTRVMATGAYSVKSLPPGSYYVVAVPDEQSSNWTDPASLEALARDATLVDLQEGSTKTQSLRTVRRAREPREQ
jgi:hypothetical protein